MEFIIRFFIIFLKYVRIIATPIYWFLNRQRPPDIPAIKNPLLILSATDLSKKIRKRQISSEAAVEAYVERIKEVNPQLNAVIENRFRAAIRDARAIDKKLEAGEVNISQLERDQPLYGVPFTVKESCGLKGMSQTGCTLVRRNKKATEEGFAVASLKRAGAIPLCVTNTPELCTGFDSSNLLYGSTNNPYDTRYIAGGSSGGEGALLGAGASLIGVGSDIAGSIRVPSLFNGIFGHKPSTGIIPIKGHFPSSQSAMFQKYLVVGPMTRYADDLLLAMKIMCKTSKENLRLNEPVDINKVKVFHMGEFTKSIGSTPVAHDIKKCIKNAALYLQGQGATVSYANIDGLENVYEIVVSMFFCMADMPQILINPDDPEHEKNPWIEIAKAFLGLSNYTKNAIMIKIFKDTQLFLRESKLSYYERKCYELQSQYENLLGTDGVLLFPSFTSPALLHNESFFRFTGGSYTLLFNIFGFPSTQVPMGLNKEGLPTGFQVIAARNQDRLCLAVAKELETGFGGWIPPR